MLGAACYKASNGMLSYTIRRFQQPYSIGIRHSAGSPLATSNNHSQYRNAVCRFPVYEIPVFYFHTTSGNANATDDRTGALTTTETTVREYSLVRRTLGVQ
jgi:hypothetical protein